MNKPSDQRDSERVAELLRTAAERIAPSDPESLVTRVLAGATESFFETDSLIGPVYVAFGLDGVRYVGPATSPEEFMRRYRERFGRLISPVAEDRDVTLTGRVAAALTGERVEVPLDLSGTTLFQRRVLETVKGIPRGEVRPYVWVAREAGNPGASRAVGNVMTNNPVPLLVPCHRVYVSCKWSASRLTRSLALLTWPR